MDNLANIMLSERSQTQKVIWLYLYEISRIGKSIETESRLVFARGWGEGHVEWLLHEYKISFWDDENVLELEWRRWLYNIVNVY